MAKRKSTSYMSPGEQIAGVVFFVIYLVVLPFATDPLFRVLEKLLAVNISGTVQNMIYYYVLFAVTVIIFHKFLMRTSRQFADNLGIAWSFSSFQREADTGFLHYEWNWEVTGDGDDHV